MIRSLLVVLVVAFTFVGAGEVFAQSCISLNGETNGVILPGNPCGSALAEDGCLLGTTSGPNPLTVEVTITSLVPSAQGPGTVGVFIGDTLITTQNGSTIVGKDNGAIGLSGRSADLLTFTGGTGFFGGAFGEAVLDTEANLVSKTFNTRFRGIVCRP